MRHAAVLARDVVALRGQVNTANGMREHLSHQLNALTMNHTAVVRGMIGRVRWHHKYE